MCNHFSYYSNLKDKWLLESSYRHKVPLTPTTFNHLVIYLCLTLWYWWPCVLQWASPLDGDIPKMPCISLCYYVFQLRILQIFKIGCDNCHICFPLLISMQMFYNNTCCFHTFLFINLGFTNFIVKFKLLLKMVKGSNKIIP